MTLELVPWRGEKVPVLNGTVSRATTMDYLNWLTSMQAYQGPPPVLTTYGSRAAEPISYSFQGFVEGMLYADGPVAAVEAYRLRVFGQAPLLYQEMVDGHAGDFYDDDILDRLREPWPGGNLSDLAKRALIHGDFAGNAFVADLEDELVLLRPDWVEIVLAKREYRGGQVGWKQLGIVYYEGGLRSNVGVTFLPGEYCHFVPGLPDPLATYRGMSWLTPLVREVQADKGASEHKKAFFENAASPNLAVSLPKEITPQQFKDFVAEMDAQHRGAVNAYKTLYMAGGADVTPVGANMQQADFAGVVGKGETRIANAGGVPPTLLSFSEGMQGSSLNSGNYTAAKRNFVDTTMRDLWGNWAASLQKMDAFKPPRDRSRLWYLGKDIPFMHEDAQDVAQIQQLQASTNASLVSAGYKPQSIVQAIAHDDVTLLEHTGLTSVQLQPPATADANGVPDAQSQAADAYQQALDEFRSEVEEWEDEIARGEVERRDYYDVRDYRGRFRKISDQIGHALNEWLKGNGDEHDPLKPFTQGTPATVKQRLRTAAKELGVDVPPRASIDELKLALLTDARARFRDNKDLPHRSASFTLKGPDHRDVDVGVYVGGRTGKVQLLRESHGRPGTAVATFDDLGGLRDWADQHGEHELAQWARTERGAPKAPAKAAPTGLGIDARDRRVTDAGAVKRYRELRSSMLFERPHDFSDLSDEDLHKLREHIVADPRRDNLYKKSLAALDKEMNNRGVVVKAPRKKAAKKATPDLEQAARDRQARIDAARPLGEALPNLNRFAADASDRALLHQISTYEQTGALSPDEATRLRDWLTLMGTPAATREIEVENKVRAAYRQILGHRPAALDAWVGLADLREAIGEDVPRAELDSVLKKMLRSADHNDDGRVRMIPVANTKALKPRDREAALPYGEDQINAISFGDASPRPVPTGDRTQFRAALADIATSHGITTHHTVGDTVSYDPATMDMQGGRKSAHKPGMRVTVLEQGTSVADPDGGTVHLAKTVVVPAAETAPAKKAAERAPSVPTKATRVAKSTKAATVGDVTLGPTQFEVASGIADVPSLFGRYDYGDHSLAGAEGVVLHRGSRVPEGFTSPRADIYKGRFAQRPGLTPQESRALDLYVLSSVADPLNTSLRAGNGTHGTAPTPVRAPGGGHLTVDLDEVAAHLDAAIADSRLAEDTNLYRGVLMRPVDVGRLQPGAEFTELGYLSTTTDRTNAYSIINWRRKKQDTRGRSRVVLKILAPQGTHAALGHVEEDEVLLGRGRRMRVVDVLRPTRTGDTRVITVELLPEGDRQGPTVPNPLDETPAPATAARPSAPSVPTKATPAAMPSAPTTDLSTEDQSRVRRLIRRDPQIFATMQDRYGRVSTSGNLSEADAAWLQDVYDRDRAFVEHVAQGAQIDRIIDDNAKKAGQTPAQYRASAATRLKELLADKPIAVRVRDEAALRDILGGGRFRTQHEGARRAPGLAAHPARRRLGEQVQGVPADTPPDRRPVYGYVAVNGVEPALSAGRKIPGIAQREGQEDVLSAYGQVQVVLKPDIRSRTTVTVGDSLDEIGSVRPSPVDNPTAESLGFRGLDSVTRPGFTRTGYVEAQVHGGVRAEDIAEVVFPDTPDPATSAALDRHGIPWRVLRPGDSPSAPSSPTKAIKAAKKAAKADLPDARFRSARKGTAAAAAVGYRFDGSSTANADLFPDRTERVAISDAFASYRGVGAASMNKRLRRGEPDGRAELMDRAFERSPLKSDAVLWRGVRSGESTFGPQADWPDDLTGREWTDPAYFSTSTRPDKAAPFATAATGGTRRGVLMRVLAPAGTPAVGLRPAMRIENPEGEVLLGRGLTYRVVHDHGTSLPDGTPSGYARVLDVEVVPSPPSAPSSPTKAVEPKKALPDAASLASMGTEDRRDALDLHTVDELKAMLKARGLPVSGRKRDLVDRLVGAVAPGEAARSALGDDAEPTDDPALDEIRAWADEDEADEVDEPDVERAAGHDVTPGHDELHHYWTRGEGLAKWADSPKPWTTLVAHLTKHVGLRKAKIFASRWFIEVFGYAAGSDKNRVAHGHPPRGDRVGPG